MNTVKSKFKQSKEDMFRLGSIFALMNCNGSVAEYYILSSADSSGQYIAINLSTGNRYRNAINNPEVAVSGLTFVKSDATITIE